MSPLHVWSHPYGRTRLHSLSVLLLPILPRARHRASGDRGLTCLAEHQADFAVLSVTNIRLVLRSPNDLHALLGSLFPDNDPQMFKTGDEGL